MSASYAHYPRCLPLRVRACIHACVQRPYMHSCVRILLSFLRRVSTHSTPQSTHRRASERESAINAWHCHRSSWQRSAPRTTSERSASIVRKCVLGARAHTHIRTDGLLRRAATRLAKDRVQRTIDGPQT